jgi:hypothetical protein
VVDTLREVRFFDSNLENKYFFVNLKRRKIDELDPYGSLIKIEKKTFFQVLLFDSGRA